MLASKTVSQGDTQLVVRFQGLSVGGEGADMRVIVPTPMTVSRQHLASLTLASGGHPLVVGPASSGKSLLLRHLLAASPLLTPSSTHTMYNCLSVASTGLEMQVLLPAALPGDPPLPACSALLLSQKPDACHPQPPPGRPAGHSYPGASHTAAARYWARGCHGGG